MEQYYLLILLVTVGFLILAFALIMPIYLFLKREEEVSAEWTEEALARRLQAGQNGAPGEPPPQARCKRGA